jgi:hypothetical protein
VTQRSFQKLMPEPVAATVTRLQERIEERFPTRGIVAVAAELRSLVDLVAENASAHRGRIRTVRLACRGFAGVIVLGTVVALVLAIRSAHGDAGPDGLDWLPLIETTVNDLVFAAIAVYFLYTVPERLQRGSILALLHQLRSLAHIIDMHQLTKDPERLRASFKPTSMSVELDLDRDEMERYLDYCSEMLSLVGKTAALCAEESRDSVVLDTVSTIETLTTGMSRKIWQKISVLPVS